MEDDNKSISGREMLIVIRRTESLQIKSVETECNKIEYAVPVRLTAMNQLTVCYILRPLTDCIKIITGKYDSDCGLSLYLRSDIVYASITRGNKFKLVPQHCKYDL